MSSFNADKKREHESLAEKALAARDYAKAFFHTTQAAEFTFILAEKSEGDVARAYLEDANGLVEIAAGLKAKIPSTNRNVSKESSGEGNPDASAKSKWTVSSVGDIRLDDVKGLAEAKAVVTDALINPVNHPDVYKELKDRPGTALLLYGPPGTGKTMFAKAIANEINAVLMRVSPGHLRSRCAGETEANISKMFTAAKSHKRCVLLLEVCVGLLRKSSNYKAVVERFLAELNDLKNNDERRLFVLLETDAPWKLNRAVTRSDCIDAAIYVGLPDKETRRLIIDSAIRNVPLAADVDLDRLVDMTEGYTACELVGDGFGLCFKVKENAVKRWIMRMQNKDGEWNDNSPEPITFVDFAKAFDEIAPLSHSFPETVKKYEKWRLAFGRRSR